MTQNPDRLQVLTKAKQLAISVHLLCDRHQSALKRQMPTLRTQLLRAVDSVPLNIAEGAGKGSPASFSYHLDVAIGSCNEVEVQLDLAIAVGALPTTAKPLLAQVVEVRRMAIGLRKRILSRGTE
ncbi:MAG: four helix bundle protein [Gemmatimonadaceae bacterium]|nr:four helix bundle protein [Gemmatimonadaceae bacterium]